MPKIILFPSPFQSERTLMDVNPGTTVREAVSLAKPFLRFDGALLVHNDQRVELSDVVLEDEDTLIVRSVPAGGVGDAIVRAGGDAWHVMTQMAQNPFLLVSGGFLLGGAITFLYSLGSSGVTALIPKPPHFDTSTTNGSLGLHGGRNGMKPYTPVPLILGKSIVAPPMGSKVFTDWDGSTPAKQILNQVFVVGLGRLAVTAMKIGDRALTDFVVAPTATVQTLTNDTYSKIVTEAGIGIELKSAAPQIQVSVADVDAMSLDIVFPSGLTSYNSDGNRTTSRTIGLTVEYKKTTTGTWTGAASFALSYAENFTQAITKKADITQAMLNAAGRAGYTGTWDVRVTRNTSDSGDSKQIDRTSWSVLRSIQLKEPMSAAAKGITTRVALTIQATDQLNGAVDNFNCEAQSVVPCYDGSGSGAAEWKGATALGYPSTWKNVNMTTGGYTWNTWTGDATSNPAALYLWILRGPANPKPIPDTLIDWPAFEAWYTFCASKGLEVNAVWDQGGAMLDLLDKIAGTGRAASMMRDSKYSVIFDQPQSVPVQHFTPRNSRNFSASKAFPTPVHAIRSQFIDQASAWKQAEQIVYMAGYSAGTATEFRTQQLWGVTNYQQAYKAIFYQVAVETLRPEIYQMEVDFEHLACQRGDLVAVSHDVLLYGLQAARVVSLTVNGGLQALTVTLDEDVTMEVGKSYGLRWRRMDGTSVVAPVNLAVGTTRTLTFTTPVVVGSVPEVDDLCSFGISGSETQMMLVVSIEMQDEFSARVTLNNYDPAVYTADSGAIPAWSSGISLPAPVGYGDLPDLSVPTTTPVAAPTRAADVAYVDAQKQVSPGTADLVAEYTFDDIADQPFTVTTDPGDSAYSLSGGDRSMGTKTFKRTTAGNSWSNVAFSSVHTIGPGAMIQAIFPDVTKHIFIGLTKSTTPYGGFGTIDYAIYCNAGQVLVYEKGVNVVPAGLGTVTNGQALYVIYDGLNIVYQLNGSTVRTVYAGPGLTFRADSEFYEFGAYVTGIDFSTQGLAYFQDAWATVDGWANAGSGLVYVANGTLEIAGTNYATSSKYIGSGGLLVIRARQVGGTLGNLACDLASPTSTIALGALTAEFKTYAIKVTNATLISIYRSNYATVSGTLIIDWIYVGQGYQSALTDTSRNASKMFLQSTIPTIGITGKGVDFGGVGYGVPFFPVGTTALSLWFKTTMSAGEFRGLVGGGSFGSLANYWMLGVGNVDGSFGDESVSFFAYNASSALTLMMQVREGGSSAKYGDGKWHHLVVAFGGANGIWVDGSAKAVTYVVGSVSTDVKGITQSAGSVIAKDPTGNQKHSVALDEFRTYQRALTDAEVLWLYANPGQVPAQAVDNAKAAAVAAAPKYLGKWENIAPVAGNIGDTYTRYSTTAGATNRGVFRWNGATWDRTEDPQYLVGQAIDDISQIITYKNTSGSAIYGAAADYSGNSTVQSMFGFFWIAIIQQLQASLIKAIGITYDGSNNVTAGMEIDLVNSRIRSPQFRARGKAGDGDPLSLGPVSAPTLRAKEDGTLQIGSMTIAPGGIVSDTTVTGILRPKMLYSSAHRVSITASPQTYDIYTVSYATGDTYKIRRTHRITIEIGSETFSFLSLETQSSASAPASCPISGVALTAVTQSGGPFTTLYILRATVTGRSGQLLNVFIEQLSAQEGPTSLPSDFDA